MTDIATPNDKPDGLSWRKIAAQSFAIALHVGAFMFLLAPVKAPPQDKEQEEDIVEVVFLEPRNGNVLRHRIARELAAVEQDRAPEYVHPRKVHRPVLDPLGEDGPQERIIANTAVEGLDQRRHERFVDAERHGMIALRCPERADLFAGAFGDAGHQRAYSPEAADCEPATVLNRPRRCSAAASRGVPALR